jgi:hypothetical protein
MSRLAALYHERAELSRRRADIDRAVAAVDDAIAAEHGGANDGTPHVTDVERARAKRIADGLRSKAGRR